jgi:hypothetical protein
MQRVSSSSCKFYQPGLRRGFLSLQRAKVAVGEAVRHDVEAELAEVLLQVVHLATRRLLVVLGDVVLALRRAADNGVVCLIGVIVVLLLLRLLLTLSLLLLALGTVNRLGSVVLDVSVLLELGVVLLDLLLDIDEILALCRVVARIGDNLLVEPPVLDRADDVDSELTVLAQRLVPVRRQTLLEDHHARNRVHEHVAHGATVLGVGVDVLHAAQAGVRVTELVPFADDLEHVGDQVGDLEFLRHQVQIEEHTEVGLLAGNGERARVEPADEGLEGIVIIFGESERLCVAAFSVEDLAEEWRVVAQELLVKDPVCVLFADVDVDHRAREQPSNTRLATINLMRLEPEHFPAIAIDEIYLLVKWLLVRHDGYSDLRPLGLN